MRIHVSSLRGLGVTALAFLLFVTAGCQAAQPVTGPQSFVTLGPTPTFAATSTLFDILPNTGNAALATPRPHYDPLLATLTTDSTGQAADSATAGATGDAGAVAAVAPTSAATLPAEQPTVIPPANAAQSAGTQNTEQSAGSIPTGRLYSPILGLIPSRQGIWAMRPDGTQPTLLTSDPVSTLVASPGGTMAAYLTNVNGSGAAFDQPYGYELKIITLYNDQVYTITGLAPAGLGPNSSQPALDSAYQTLQAYGRGGLAWSPDGARLAFVSGHEGDVKQANPGNVYIYTPSQGKLEKVSNLSLPNGPAHAYELTWSRDGALLYYTAAYGFGQDAADVAGSWVYALNGNAVQIAPERQSMGEHLEGWLPGGRVLLSSRGPCGDFNLRTVDYRSGNTQVIFPPCYTDLFYNRAFNEALVSLTPDRVDPNSGLNQGVYLVSLWSQQPTPRKITDMGFVKLYNGDYRADWYGYNPAEGLTGIQRSGRLVPTFSGPPFDGSQGELPQPLGRLPDNVTWLWSSPSGLFTARPGSQPKPVLNQPTQHMIGSPTRVGLYFFFAPDQSGVQRLFAINARDWQPVQVDPRIENPNDLVWVP